MSSLCSYNASECALSKTEIMANNERACRECDQFPRAYLPGQGLPLARKGGKVTGEHIIDNALVTSKDCILELVRDGQLESALACLSVVSSIWNAHHYGYKGREIAERIRQAIQNEDMTDEKHRGLYNRAMFVYSQFTQL